ncbi:Early light-induced, chloroplastic [Cinnamomum micranthum f. kanehirae]|uniref:Early light-induced, chloroplastic n=1 Tax=Cinnamomum micranthum f. kanehirae TaxID=337451 RepID=A0A3S3QVR5_9MAGN|nr:Early light-induced, chloroplastic [Cinnamomum micranthum f. kanehirae]
MGSSSFLINGALCPSSPPLNFSYPSSAFTPRGRLQRKQDTSTVVQATSSHTLRMLANANASPGKRNRKAEVVMVDPLEAKRLAAKQMQEIRAKEKLKRQRQIEAINGAWAMIGLTAGLVIEGQTGNGILTQVFGYLKAIIGVFWR